MFLIVLSSGLEIVPGSQLREFTDLDRKITDLDLDREFTDLQNLQYIAI